MRRTLFRLPKMYHCRSSPISDHDHLTYNLVRVGSFSNR